jgi:hypothetical protein
MVEQVTLQTIIMLIQAVGILVAVFYHIMTLQNTRKNQQLTLETRQAQLLMQIYDDWRNPDQLRLFAKSLRMKWDSYEDFQNNYSVEKFEERLPFTSMSYFFEGVGVLVEEGLIDIELVAKLMSGDLKTHWEKFRSYILEAREVRNYPQFFDKTEYLYNQVENLRGRDWIDRTVTDITKEEIISE